MEMKRWTEKSSRYKIPRRHSQAFALLSPSKQCDGGLVVPFSVCRSWGGLPRSRRKMVRLESEL